MIGTAPMHGVESLTHSSINIVYCIDMFGHIKQVKKAAYATQTAEVWQT